MANPGTDIIWRGYGWSRSHRRVVRPDIEAAIELSHDAVEEMGVTYHQPKRAHIRRCGRSVLSLGASSDATNFELFIRQDLVRHRRLGDLCANSFVTAGHELIHNARAERYDIWDAAEEIASEGLAHAAEDMLRLSLSVEDNLGFYGDEIDPTDTQFLGALKRSLVRDIRFSRGDDTRTDAVVERWFNFESDYMDQGTRLGLSEVYCRLIEGHTLPEMMEWPADQILDLGNVAA